MTDANELKSALCAYYGTENYYKHSLMGSRFLYTDGVRFFAQNAGGGAYWFLDILATQPEIREAMKKHGLCIVVLSVKSGAASIDVARDMDTGANGEPVFTEVDYHRDIEATDCPEGYWKFYILPGDENFRQMIAILPSEY